MLLRRKITFPNYRCQVQEREGPVANLYLPSPGLIWDNLPIIVFATAKRGKADLVLEWNEFSFYESQKSHNKTDLY